MRMGSEDERRLGPAGGRDRRDLRPDARVVEHEHLARVGLDELRARRGIRRRGVGGEPEKRWHILRVVLDYGHCLSL